jgi:hypothetical protein
LDGVHLRADEAGQALAERRMRAGEQPAARIGDDAVDIADSGAEVATVLVAEQARFGTSLRR